MIFAFVSQRIYKLENWLILADYLVKSAGQFLYFNHLPQNTNLMGSSSLNTHGISKRVIYSKSVNKMLQHGIEKLNFSNGPFWVLYILIKL